MNPLELLAPQTSAWIVESLAHLLWQGSLIAGLAALVGIALRSRWAQARYIVFCFALFATSACLPLNLWMFAPQDSGALAELPAAASVEIGNQSFTLEDDDDTVVKWQTPLQAAPPDQATSAYVAFPLESGVSTHSWWMAASRWITAAYALGVVVMALRLLMSLYGSQRLRATAGPLDDARMGRILARIVERLRLNILPIVAYSSRVTTPVVVGVLKPAILLPAAILSELTPEQVESLLLHELAHIRRYDHVVNLLQRIIETALFFHPAVWWLSRKVNVEREHCCDDLAIAWGSRPCDYAESLVRVSELRYQRVGLGATTAATLAATGGRPTRLRSRVLRVLGMPLPGPSVGLTRFGAATIAAVALSCVALLAAAPDPYQSLTRADLADLDFDAPPPAYEKGVLVADQNQNFQVDGLRFSAGPLQWKNAGWLRLPEGERGVGEELFLNLGVSGGYEVVEFRLFDHADRELIHTSKWQRPGALNQKFFVQRIGATNWVRMKETGGTFPNQIDVWMRIATSTPGRLIVLQAEEGASAKLGASEIVVTSLLEGSMNGQGGPDGRMVWDLASASDKDRFTTVNLENRGNALQGRYHLVAVTNDGARHPMDHTHFRDFSMDRYTYVLLDAALKDLDHLELVPFQDRHKFFFNGLGVPGKPPADANDSDEQTVTATRTRHFVRVVAGDGKIALDGDVLPRGQLQARLEQIPDREHTVLEYGRTSDSSVDLDELFKLSIGLGFEYFSVVGDQPLTATGSPDEQVERDLQQERRLAQIIQQLREQQQTDRVQVKVSRKLQFSINGLVIPKGREVAVLRAVPNRVGKVLEVALATIPPSPNEALQGLAKFTEAAWSEESQRELWKVIGEVLGFKEVRFTGAGPTGAALTIDLLQVEGNQRGTPTYWIGYQQVTQEELRQRVQRLPNGAGSVSIRVHQEAPYQWVVELTGLVREWGAQRVGLVVFPTEPVFAIDPAPGRDGAIRGKVIAPAGSDGDDAYSVYIEHEAWANHSGEPPSLEVAAGEAFEFRNLPAGKCMIHAARNAGSSAGSDVAQPTTDIEVVIESKEAVEVEIKLNVDVSHQTTPATSVARQWLRLVQGERFDEADKLADPARAGDTHDVRDSELLRDIQFHNTLIHDNAVLIVSESKQQEGEIGSFVFRMHRDPRTESGWIVRDVDFVGEDDLKPQIAAFTAPVLANRVIERTLLASENPLLDLESGRVLHIDDDWETRVDEPLKWIAVRGGDVTIGRSSTQPVEIKGLGVLGQTKRVAVSLWDNPSVQQIEAALKDVPMKGVVLSPTAEELPATYAFRTHGHPANEPRLGVLQILGIDGANKQVQLRYRIVAEDEVEDGDAES